VHDLGSAVYPFAVISPFFDELRLNLYGLEWIYSPASLAHPLDDGTAVMLEGDVNATAGNLEREDATAYRDLLQPVVDDWEVLVPEVLRPILHVPSHPIALARFGLRAALPATVLAKTIFKGARARALFAGLAAHSVLKLEAPLTSAFGILFAACGHTGGWPIAAGGSQKITDALISVLTRLGGTLNTDARVNSLEELGGPDLTLCDVSPKGFLQIAEKELHGRPFADLMRQYRYGPGAFKMDWALREPIPWRAKECVRAATVHIGGTLEEIAASERVAADGRTPTKPFILLAQPSPFDHTRAPKGQHTAWAYCHVPNGWTGSAQQQIEDQIERFAPGFRECILARSVLTPARLQAADENLVGGDVNCGSPNTRQFVFRPTWRQYGTPLKGVYLCSSATPPGGGVHGMCGHNAAVRALGWLQHRARK
jgi:phytoene dehydrogenase-like protein